MGGAGYEYNYMMNLRIVNVSGQTCDSITGGGEEKGAKEYVYAPCN